MKYLYKILPVFLIALVISCGDDGNGSGDPEPENPTFADEILEANTWQTASVSSDSNGDLTSEFAGFTVTFSNGSYTANNTAYGIFENSGSYGLRNVSETGLDIDLSNGNSGTAQVNGDQINLDITVFNTSFGGGRLTSLAGTYRFVLKK